MHVCVLIQISYDRSFGIDEVNGETVQTKVGHLYGISQ